jgi:hypothetical protein
MTWSHLFSGATPPVLLISRVRITVIKIEKSVGGMTRHDVVEDILVDALNVAISPEKISEKSETWRVYWIAGGLGSVIHLVTREFRAVTYTVDANTPLEFVRFIREVNISAWSVSMLCTI